MGRISSKHGVRHGANYDMTRKEIFRYTGNCRHSILTLNSPTREEKEYKAVTFTDKQIMIVARAIAEIENHMGTRTMPSRVGRYSLQVQASQFWCRYSLTNYVTTAHLYRKNAQHKMLVKSCPKELVQHFFILKQKLSCP